MHVLVVAIRFPSPIDPYSGNFIGQQVQALAERVERITVLCPVPKVPRILSKLRRFTGKFHTPEQYELVPHRCEVRFPRYLKGPGEWLLSWTKIQWCRLVDQTIDELAKTHPVSLIHAHTGSVSAWAGLYAAKRHNIPVAVTYHGSEVHTVLAGRRKGWRLCRASFESAHLNLPVSRALERTLRSEVTPSGACHTLLLGVDRSRFYPSDRLARTPTCLYVGRIQEGKGVFDLLHAWTGVVALHPDARLTMIGEDRTEGAFQALVRSLGLEGSIRLMGPLPPQEVAKTMRESRVFCLPSHHEGTPVSVMEAMACGLPVVSTRVGGIPDIVSHGRSGLLVEQRDVHGLTESLESLFRDSAQCLRMRTEALAFAETHLDIRRNAEKLVALYHDTIEGFEADRRSSKSEAGSSLTDKSYSASAQQSVGKL